MMSEFPWATAIALMNEPLVPALILVQVGVEALTFTLRQRLLPPASKVLGLLGSRINGAIKLALASGSPSGPPPSGSPPSGSPSGGGGRPASPNPLVM